jgi:hypothetical protein
MRTFAMQINNLSSTSEQFIFNPKPTNVREAHFSFEETLPTSTSTRSNATTDSGTVTLNFHSMTGNQFLAVEQTLVSEGKATRGFLSPAENDMVPTDQIAMYGSWANHSPTAAASLLDQQKTLVSQGDSAGNVTVDAAAYSKALAFWTGSVGK